MSSLHLQWGTFQPMTETTRVAGFYLIEFWLPHSAACVEAYEMLGVQQGTQMAEFHVSMAWML